MVFPLLQFNPKNIKSHKTANRFCILSSNLSLIVYNLYLVYKNRIHAKNQPATAVGIDILPSLYKLSQNGRYNAGFDPALAEYLPAGYLLVRWGDCLSTF